MQPLIDDKQTVHLIISCFLSVAASRSLSLRTIVSNSMFLATPREEFESSRTLFEGLRTIWDFFQKSWCQISLVLEARLISNHTNRCTYNVHGNPHLTSQAGLGSVQTWLFSPLCNTPNTFYTTKLKKTSKLNISSKLKLQCVLGGNNLLLASYDKVAGCC